MNLDSSLILGILVALVVGVGLMFCFLFWYFQKENVLEQKLDSEQKPDSKQKPNLLFRVVISTVIICLLVWWGITNDWGNAFFSYTSAKTNEVDTFIIHLEPDKKSRSIKIPVGYKIKFQLLSGEGEKVLCIPNKSWKKAIKMKKGAHIKFNEPMEEIEFLSNQSSTLEVKIMPM